MNFERNDEQRAIAETARNLLADRGSSENLYPELCELGWPGIAIDEDQGGSGLGLIELTVLIEEHGYACAPTPLLGTTLAAIAIDLCGSEELRAELLPALASGGLLGALARFDRDELIPDASAGSVLVVGSAATGQGWLHRSGGVEPVEAIDPRRRHGRLDPTVEGEELHADLRPSLARAMVVVAAELVGLSRRALDLTVDFVKERNQFGVAVGSFQAVQHKTAEMLRETEAAAVLVSHAAWVADHEPERLPNVAATAKVSASSAGRFVTAAAIQLHGGIGFTWEADLHWLYKRAQIDAAYLGSAQSQRDALIRSLAREPAIRS